MRFKTFPISNPWLIIFLIGIFDISILCLALYITMLNLWPAAWLGGLILGLVLLSGLFYSRLPLTIRQGLTQTPHADLWGGMLLGGILLGGALAAFTTAELFSRTRHESQWIVYRVHPEIDAILPYPNQSKWDYRSSRVPHYVTIDEEGFRVLEHTSNPDAPQILRILCLGDSFTYGLAVNNDQTFPYFLERELEQRLGYSHDVTVFAAGSNWMTLDGQLGMYDFLMERGDQFDIVVLGYYGDNDVSELDTLPAAEIALKQHLPPWLVNSSALLRWLQYQNFTYGIPGYNQAIEEHAKRAPWDVLYAQYAELFGELVARTETNHQRLMVLVIEGWARRSGLDTPQGEFMQGLLDQYQIEMILPPHADENYLIPRDHHFTPDGNRIVARSISEQIAAYYLPPQVYQSKIIVIFQQPDGALHVYRYLDGQGVFLTQFYPDQTETSWTAENGWQLELSDGHFIVRDETGDILDEDFQLSSLAES